MTQLIITIFDYIFYPKYYLFRKRGYQGTLLSCYDRIIPWGTPSGFKVVKVNGGIIILWLHLQICIGEFHSWRWKACNFMIEWRSKTILGISKFDWHYLRNKYPVKFYDC